MIKPADLTDLVINAEVECASPRFRSAEGSIKVQLTMIVPRDLVEELDSDEGVRAGNAMDELDEMLATTIPTMMRSGLTVSSWNIVD